MIVYVKLPISWTGQSHCPIREMVCAYAQFMNWPNCLPIFWIVQLKICSVHELGKLCVRKIISRHQLTDWVILTAQFVKRAEQQITVLAVKSLTCNAGNVLFSWQRVLKATVMLLLTRVVRRHNCAVIKCQNRTHTSTISYIAATAS